MDVLLLSLYPLRIFLVEGLVFVNPRCDLTVDFVRPQLPARVFSSQHLRGENPIAGSILHVDAQIIAAHRNYKIQIHLKLMRHTFLHAEMMVFRASEPREKFGDR